VEIASRASAEGMNYRITLAYDGTEYAGWQMQLGRPTIQAAVEKALETIEGAAVTTYAAGRTDAGVHVAGSRDRAKDGRCAGR
jgi:tRNA pseudouridine38-40 synthase